MLSIYKTVDGKVESLKTIEKDAWIDLVEPTEEEISLVVSETKVEEDFLRKLLDEEEMPHIETSKNATLVVIDTPFVLDSAYKNKYRIYPLGIVISEGYFITVSTKPVALLEDFKNNKVSGFFSEKKTRFTIQILFKLATLYQKHLKTIDEDIRSKEKVLKKSTNNKEILSLLDIEKNLVYFINSLNANDCVLNKLSKGAVLDLYEEDQDILEDAMIENKQSIAMANVYREILTSMTDTYATIVSNNMNVIIKFLTGITIVFSIPTMVASFLGMNVNLGVIGTYKYSFVCVVLVSIVFSLLLAVILKKKNLL